MKIRLNPESKYLIRDSSLVIVATYTGGAILFLANILLAKKFGPQDFGTFKTVINLFSFLPALIDLGIGATFVKYIAQLPEEKAITIIGKFLRLLFYIYSITIIMILIFRKPLVIYFLKDYSLNPVFCAGIVVFIFFYLEIFKYILQGFQEFKLYAFSQFLTLSSIGILTSILGYYLGICYAVIGWGIGYLLGNIINIQFLLKKRVFEKRYIEMDFKKVFLEYSLPMHLTTISGFLSLAVIPILSLFFIQRLIGYLAFSFIFYQGVIAVPTAFSIVLFPRFSKLAKQYRYPKDLLRQAFYIYTPIVITGTFLCLVFAEIFIKILFPVYLAGSPVFINLVCFALISGYLIIYKIYLAALGKFRSLIPINLIHSFGLLVVSFISLKSL